MFSKLYKSAYIAFKIVILKTLFIILQCGKCMRLLMKGKYEKEHTK